MEIKIYTDGGALGNPGPAAYAFILYKEKKLFLQDSKFIGRATNNIAEYSAVIGALEKILRLKIEKKLSDISRLVFLSDSNLMVNQLNGLFKIKSAAIREFVLKIKGLENQIGLPISYKHIPREKNYLADYLVKATLKNPY